MTAVIRSVETTCGVVIFDRRIGKVRTCGAKASQILTFDDDHLFSICHRHNDRVDRALFGRRAAA